jgi:hypothetical protein
MVRFARSSRRHKIGRSHALAALLSGVEPTVEIKERGGINHPFPGWVANDDRGVDLHIVGRVAVGNPELVIIIHVMPTHLRRS